ncbi:MAG: hypothetical protein U0744_00405 [Gemmataceae bacterium]
MNPTDSDLRMLESLRTAPGRCAPEIGKIIIGQQEVLDQLLMAIFCRGHALLVGVPGARQDPHGEHALTEGARSRFKRIRSPPT